MTIDFRFSAEICTTAKWAFTTRRVHRCDAVALTADLTLASAGDLLLCEVLEIGQHKKVQLADRRGSELFPGDFVVLCLGDRYAPDQFHGSACADGETLDLVAGGGVVGRVEAAHAFMDEPTRLRPIGLLLRKDGAALNVGSYALPALPVEETVTVIGVFGASMNSGKTTAAASLARGIVRAGYGVVGVKATGTGAFGDYNAFSDAGVDVLDFTDAGMATTYRMPMERIERGFDTLVATAAASGAECVVVEFADGVFQQETRAILAGGRIRNRLDGLLFAAPDALSALGGAIVLERHGLRPFAISGMVSCSPLAAAEAAEAVGLPILSREELWEPAVIARHVAPLMRVRPQRTAA